MKPGIHTLLSLAAIAAFALTAASANAAPIATLSSEAPSDGNTNNHIGTIQAAVGDLLETVGSVAGQSNAVPTQHITASLFNGKISTGTANGANGGDPDAPNAAGYYGTGHFIEFNLDTTTNTLGYDISAINIIQRGDHFRPGINVAISVRPVGGSYTSLINPPDAGTANNVNMYSITNDSGPFVATGIDGIRFDFANTTGTISGWTWYRELDVIGTPTGGPTDTTPPTLAASDIVDDQGGGPVVQNTPVTYTVTFSEDMNAGTVSAEDFSNAGTASVDFGAVVETSPGVFTVAVTPTSAGTLRLQVPVGATMTDVAGNPLNTTSAIPDDTEITVEAAAVIATLTSEATNGSPHAGPLINAVSGDLLETVGSVAAEGGNGDGSRHVTSSVYDGSITTGTSNTANGGDPTAANAAGYWGDNHFIEFDLDTSTNVHGYDIALIQIIQMGDHFRPGIHVTVSLRQVGGSYTTLISPPDAGTGGNVNRYAITSGSGPFIASGIDGVRFDFSNTVGTISGWTWYRELDVVGEPSGPRPEIAVEQPPGTDIPTNGTKDFRWVSVGSHTDLVFTIKNTGTADLTGLTITKDGSNAAEFTVISDPTAPVAGPDGSTTFTVRFAPAAPGTRSAAIHIANNDYNENPFHINLTGIGTTSADRQSGALRIFLLAGQSNMEGQAYAFDSATTASWNVPTMQFLASGTAAATNYLANMPFGFKTSLNPGWLLPRNDAWAVHYNSSNGAVKEVLPSNNPADMLSGIQLLSPGFGAGTGNGSMIGPELAMGIRLADATGDPVFLFKSSMGGTTLGNDWRPPAAVTARGGSVGVNYTNTVNRFREFLDTLDADLADDGKLNRYHNATSYKVSGVVWFQGWNEMFDDAPYTAAQLQAEYKDNLKDLIHSLRNADRRMPADLPLIIPESADQNANLNASRVAAVAELNAVIANTAVYIENNDMIGAFWGNNELGVPFSTEWGYHFNARAENYLEVGWRIGGAALANGYLISNSATVARSLTGPDGPFVGQTDPDVVGFAANPDGDRWVNALEVLFGFNAALADGAMPMTTSFATDGANTYLEVQVMVDAAMDDLMNWHLEFSSDLENWAESSNPRTVIGQSGSLRTIAIRDDQAAGTTPGRFYRIKLLAGD